MSVRGVNLDNRVQLQTKRLWARSCDLFGGHCFPKQLRSSPRDFFSEIYSKKRKKLHHVTNGPNTSLGAIRKRRRMQVPSDREIAQGLE